MTLRSCFAGTKRRVSHVRIPVDTLAARANMARPCYVVLARAERAAPGPLPSHVLASSPRQRPEGASRMMRKPIPTLTARHLFSALSLAGALASLVFVLAACEDKAIGRRCDVQADAGINQAVFNGQALECPTRICVKPARDVA